MTYLATIIVSVFPQLLVFMWHGHGKSCILSKVLLPLFVNHSVVCRAVVALLLFSTEIVQVPARVTWDVVNMMRSASHMRAAVARTATASRPASVRSMSVVAGPEGGNKYAGDKRMPVNPVSGFARSTCVHGDVIQPQRVAMGSSVPSSLLDF